MSEGSDPMQSASKPYRIPSHKELRANAVSNKNNRKLAAGRCNFAHMKTFLFEIYFCFRVRFLLCINYSKFWNFLQVWFISGIIFL
jgi:hypothetical protein